MLLFCSSKHSLHFSFMPCQPACSCMIADHESHLLPPRIKPCGEMRLAFDFPPDPPLCALASDFPAVPAFLFATANPSICMAFLNISFLQVCIGSLVPPAGGVGCRPPATLRLLCYTWPSGALLAKNGCDAPQSLFLGPPDPLFGW